MRLHRFYISGPITGDTIEITDRDLVHQWKKVFRYNVGSQVIVFDGSGRDYFALISSLRPLGATLSVVQKKLLKPISREVWLGMALVKKDNFELVAQKATELGVACIIPLLCEHSEKKNISHERVRKITVEASEQSGRGDVPRVDALITLQDLFANADLPEHKVCFHPKGAAASTLDDGSSKPILVLIGPEGGWSESEIDLCTQNGVSVVSLGNQILRAETAAIASLSLLLL